MLTTVPTLAHGLIVRKGPLAPFTGAQYKTTVTTTTNETTSTFTDIEIGAPHPDRLVILAIYQGTTNAPTATVNDIPQYHVTTQNEFAVLACLVPTGTTATILVSATSSLRKAVGVYVAYPSNPIPLEFGANSAGAATNAVVTNLDVQNAGCVVYAGGQHATLGDFTVTWTGIDAVTENVDAQLEEAASYTNGHLNITRSTTQDDLTLAESVSGAKRLIVASWGPARGYA